MIPILVTVVVSPAKNGNAPHTPQPIAPKKNNFLYSFLIILKFFFKDKYINGKIIINTTVHLQNANEIGGTNSTPPLATTKLDAINMGWINKRENAKRLFFLVINFNF